MNPSSRYRHGDLIGGRYHVYYAQRGTQYACLDQETNMPVVLCPLSDPEQLDTAKCWLALASHPNVVQCHTIEALDNTDFAVKAWIVGEDQYDPALSRWLQRGPLNQRLALRFAID